MFTAGCGDISFRWSQPHTTQLGRRWKDRAADVFGFNYMVHAVGSHYATAHRSGPVRLESGIQPHAIVFRRVRRNSR